MREVVLLFSEYKTLRVFLLSLMIVIDMELEILRNLNLIREAFGLRKYLNNGV
jgi:hypothetical protein